MSTDDNIYGLEQDDQFRDYRTENLRSPERYDDRQSKDPTHCPHCGYALTGAAAGNFCPGCGSPLRFNPYSRQTSGYAVSSLIMGILAVLSCIFYGIGSLVFGPLAIIFASKAHAQVAAGQASPASLGLSTAGRILGIIGLSIFAAVAIAFIAVIILGVAGSVP